MRRDAPSKDFTMIVLLGALCVALFFLGHAVRDGWPDFKKLTNGVLGTNAARITGAVLCAVGLTLFAGLTSFALVASLGVLAGFYLDMKHGEAQADRGFFRDMPFLSLSGVTSVFPIALAGCLLSADWSLIFHGWEILGTLDWGWLAFALVGLAKVFIWPACWRLGERHRLLWDQPSRFAAAMFGAVIGAALVGVRCLLLP